MTVAGEFGRMETSLRWESNRPCQLIFAHFCTSSRCQSTLSDRLTSQSTTASFPAGSESRTPIGHLCIHGDCSREVSAKYLLIWSTSFEKHIKYSLTYHPNSFVWKIFMYIAQHSSFKQRWCDYCSGHGPDFSSYMYCRKGFLAYLTRSIQSEYSQTLILGASRSQIRLQWHRNTPHKSRKLMQCTCQT